MVQKAVQVPPERLLTVCLGAYVLGPHVAPYTFALAKKLLVTMVYSVMQGCGRVASKAHAVTYAVSIALMRKL